MYSSTTVRSCSAKHGRQLQQQQHNVVMPPSVSQSCLVRFLLVFFGTFVSDQSIHGTRKQTFICNSKVFLGLGGSWVDASSLVVHQPRRNKMEESKQNGKQQNRERKRDVKILAVLLKCTVVDSRVTSFLHLIENSVLAPRWWCRTCGQTPQ